MQRLKSICDTLLSSVAFKFKLGRYSMGHNAYLLMRNPEAAAKVRAE
jgi:hypothetical protein